MGCATSLSEKCYESVEEVQCGISQLISQLPRAYASAQKKYVLELKGKGYIFSPLPPQDSRILSQVKVTERDFINMVNSINRAHAYAFVGQPIVFRPADIPERRRQSANAVAAQVAILNRDDGIMKGCRWELHAGASNLNDDGVYKIRWQDTFLYLQIPDETMQCDNPLPTETNFDV